MELNGLICLRLFALSWLAMPLFGQYAGPAILSRGEPPAALSGTQLDFRPYVEISSVYSSGLAGVLVSDTGGVASTSGYGNVFSIDTDGSNYISLESFS